MIDKIALRKQFLPRRQNAFTGDPAEVAGRLRVLLPKSFKEFVLAAYFPIRSEWDPWPIIASMDQAVQTALPITPPRPGPLTFRQWAPGDGTVEAKFNTREPLSCAPLVALTEMVFLVPGVAIDKNGIRLGYGGGYYDRTFAQLGEKLDRSRLIGFMLDEQISDQDLPCEDTDIALGHLITPTRSLNFHAER